MKREELVERLTKTLNNLGSANVSNKIIADTVLTELEDVFDVDDLTISINFLNELDDEIGSGNSYA